MKLPSKINLLIMFLSMMFITSCGSDDPDEVVETDRVKKLLLLGEWNVASVTVDGVDTDMYDGLVITFSASTVSALNGEPLWTSTETWAFSDDTAKSILRGDGLLIDILNISETELKLGLSWHKTTIGGGKASSISGEHIFLFNH